MNTYTIFLMGEKLNRYIEGRISGIIYALTDTPSCEGCWIVGEDPDHVYTSFVATEEQFDLINKAIAKAYSGIIEVYYTY